jgi:hypothetical protein
MLLILAVAGAFVILPGGGRPGLDLLRINFSIWHFQTPFFVSRRRGRDLWPPTLYIDLLAPLWMLSASVPTSLDWCYAGARIKGPAIRRLLFAASLLCSGCRQSAQESSVKIHRIVGVGLQLIN